MASVRVVGTRGHEIEGVVLMRWVFLALAAFVSLVACAPGARVIRTTHDASGAFVNFPSVLFAGDYHPNEPGRELAFLGADGEEWLLTQRGDALFEGRPYRHTVLRRATDGFERVWFHEVGPDGVWLRRVDEGDRVTVFDPMILELPAEGRLVADVRWGGEARALEYVRVGADALEFVAESDIAYVSAVTDARYVMAGGERSRVFVVSSEWFFSRGEGIERASWVRWFAPFVGVVRYEDDLSLVGVVFQ